MAAVAVAGINLVDLAALPVVVVVADPLALAALVL